ncbi:hypothetical protein D3C76_25920 [compost metagenome]
MAIYSKTTKQMVVDLINEGNPQLPFPINETDFEFSLPEVITDPGNGHNTRIRVMSKPGSEYVGNIVLTYRRLNVGFIFRNMTPFVDKWVANSGATGGTLLTFHDLIPLFNEKYGFVFNTTEWTNRNLTGYNGIRGDVFSVTPVADNLAFVGNISCKWNIGERTLESLLPVDQIPGRRFPGGNDFSDPMLRKYWMLPDTHHIDFTAQKDILENGQLTTQYLGYLSYWEVYQQFRDQVMSRVAPRPNERGISQFKMLISSSQHIDANNPDYGCNNVDMYMNGFSFTRITLPHPNYPEANSEFYNRAILMNIPAACKWATGRVFFHYNI